MILNDGETYTALTGCSLLTVNEKGIELLEEGYTPRQLSEDSVFYWSDLTEELGYDRKPEDT